MSALDLHRRFQHRPRPEMLATSMTTRREGGRANFSPLAEAPPGDSASSLAMRCSLRPPVDSPISRHISPVEAQGRGREKRDRRESTVSVRLFGGRLPPRFGQSNHDSARRAATPQPLMSPVLGSAGGRRTQRLDLHSRERQPGRRTPRRRARQVPVSRRGARARRCPRRGGRYALPRAVAGTAAAAAVAAHEERKASCPWCPAIHRRPRGGDGEAAVCRGARGACGGFVIDMFLVRACGGGARVRV